MVKVINKIISRFEDIGDERNKSLLNLTQEIAKGEIIHSGGYLGEFCIYIGKNPLISIFPGRRTVETFFLRDSSPQMNLANKLLEAYEKHPREEEWTHIKYQ